MHAYLVKLREVEMGSAAICILQVLSISINSKEIIQPRKEALVILEV